MTKTAWPVETAKALKAIGWNHGVNVAPTAEEIYKDAIKAADKAFDEAHRAAEIVFEKAGRKGYEEACAQAMGPKDEAIKAAQKAYNKTITQAGAEYQTATGKQPPCDL